MPHQTPIASSTARCYCGTRCHYTTTLDFRTTPPVNSGFMSRMEPGRRRAILAVRYSSSGPMEHAIPSAYSGTSWNLYDCGFYACNYWADITRGFNEQWI